MNTLYCHQLDFVALIHRQAQGTLEGSPAKSNSLCSLFGSIGKGSERR